MPDAITTEVPDTDQQIVRMMAVARLVLSAIEDRRDHDGKLPTSMSSVQVSIALLADLAQKSSIIDRLEGTPGESARFHFDGLLSLLDAKAWRMVTASAEDPPERDLADLEHGLRQLVDLAENMLAGLRAAEAKEEACHA
jgi:hypothetical protein